jgi:hypothetical protein
MRVWATGSSSVSASQFGGGVAAEDAASHVKHGALGVAQGLGNAVRRVGVDSGTHHRRGQLGEGAHGKVGREDVHRHIDQDGAGPPGLAQVEGPLHDARQVRHAIHTVDALAEGPVDFVLVRIHVQVHFLVRMAAEVMRGHVAGDHHQGDGIERGVGHAGGRIGETWSEVGEENARLAGGARVAIGGMGGHLLVAGGDEANAAALQGIEQCDHGVAAQPEDDLHADALQILHKLVRGNPRVACAGRRTQRQIRSSHGSLLDYSNDIQPRLSRIPA